jgi:hypothetical protein
MRPSTGQIIERPGKRGTTFGLRFRAYGKRHYVTASATTHQEAELSCKTSSPTFGAGFGGRRCD